jgi:hypothetical protein
VNYDCPHCPHSHNTKAEVHDCADQENVTDANARAATIAARNASVQRLHHNPSADKEYCTLCGDDLDGQDPGEHVLDGCTGTETDFSDQAREARAQKPSEVLG